MQLRTVVPYAHFCRSDDGITHPPTLLEDCRNYIIFFGCFNRILPERLVVGGVEPFADLPELLEAEGGECGLELLRDRQEIFATWRPRLHVRFRFMRGMVE